NEDVVEGALAASSLLHGIADALAVRLHVTACCALAARRRVFHDRLEHAEMRRRRLRTWTAARALTAHELGDDLAAALAADDDLLTLALGHGTFLVSGD